MYKLNGLVSKQLLTAADQGRGTVYYLSKIFNNDMSSTVIENNSAGSVVNSAITEDNSAVMGDNSANNGVNCAVTENKIVDNVTDYKNKSDEMESKLLEISKPAREKKRLSPNVMKQIIIKICSIRPIGVKELVNYLNRSHSAIRIEYITPLIEEGKIRPLYEGQKNHPKQAYETVKQK